MKSTVRKWLFVVIHLQIDVFIKEDIRARICTMAKQLDCACCAG